MDIRNNISELKQLANCTIIEGFLLITLINDADKLNTTYPLLTEVTGYILVFRVQNLISLSQIFPNLSVIRGNILFESYALVVYQNRDLLDIGLSNLRAITNGGVRIERNLYLCFVKTVNWRKIVSKNATDSDIVLKFNRNEAECARCPGEINDDGQENSMSDGSGVPACKEYPGNKRYCWNSRACQTSELNSENLERNVSMLTLLSPLVLCSLSQGVPLQLHRRAHLLQRILSGRLFKSPAGRLRCLSQCIN